MILLGPSGIVEPGNSRVAEHVHLYILRVRASLPRESFVVFRSPILRRAKVEDRPLSRPENISSPSAMILGKLAKFKAPIKNVPRRTST